MKNIDPSKNLHAIINLTDADLRDIIATYLANNHAFFSTHISETLINADLETFISPNDAGEFTLFDLLIDFSTHLLGINPQY